MPSICHLGHLFIIYSLYSSDELPASRVPSTNILADLVKRAYAEQDAMISRIRSRDLTTPERLVPEVLLRLERRRALRTEGTDVGMLSVGLLERGIDAAPQANGR